MGEFRREVKQIVDKLNRADKINLKEIPAMTLEAVGHQVNCYPGIPGNQCFKEAYFYSLSKQRYRGERGVDLSLYRMMSQMVQHMIGACEGNTQYAVLITDNWNDGVFNAWKSTLKKIQKFAFIEIYLITSDKFVEIEL